jgi:hypothetical protein
VAGTQSSGTSLTAGDKSLESADAVELCRPSNNTPALLDAKKNNFLVDFGNCTPIQDRTEPCKNIETELRKEPA